MNVPGIPVRKSWSKVCKLTRLYVNFARWFVQGFLDSGNILTNRKDKNNHNTKNHIQVLHDTKVQILNQW